MAANEFLRLVVAAFQHPCNVCFQKILPSGLLSRLTNGSRVEKFPASCHRGHFVLALVRGTP